MTKRIMCLALSAIFASVGCASETLDSDTPDVDLDDVGESQYVSFHGWGISAATPVYTAGMGVRASATFTGTGTKTFGVCNTVKAIPVQTCTSEANCSNISVPSGGYRYCAAPNNIGQKYCFIRPGSGSAYCAGTPATFTAHSAGTYTTPLKPGDYYFNQTNTWMAYACLDGSCPASGMTPSTGGTIDVFMGGGQQ